MLRYYVREYERFIIERLPAASEAAGRRIDSSLAIVDLSGLSMKLVTPLVQNFVKQTSFIADHYYPELMGQMVIVNAPGLFSATWSMLSYFLDKEVKARIKVVGTNCRQLLLDIVDADNLPAFLGGNCT